MFNLFRKAGPPGPDFSDTDSREKVDLLVQRGDPEKLLLLPPEFGGEDIPENIVYVPVGLAEIKGRTDVNIIAELVRDGP